MLAKKFRFHGNNSVRAVYRQGRMVRADWLMLKYAANPRRRSYRLAVVVSKKVSKSAVVRNRIRRRLYEQVRERLPAHVPYDLVLTAYDDKLATVPQKHINTTISKFLQVLANTDRARGGGVVDKSMNDNKNL